MTVALGLCLPQDFPRVKFCLVNKSPLDETINGSAQHALYTRKKKEKRKRKKKISHAHQRSCGFALKTFECQELLQNGE